MTAADDWITAEESSFLGATVFPAGALVFAKVGAGLLLNRIRLLPQPACLDNNMAAFVSDGQLNDRYLYWAANLIDFSWLVNPGAIPSVSDRNLQSYPLPIPPRGDQIAIADFLDRETAQIDTLIEKQELLIAGLRDRRQAVIDHAFADVEPDKYTRLRRFITFLTSGSRGWGDYYADAGERFVRIGNLPRTHLRLGGEVKYIDLPEGVYEGERTRLRSQDLLFSITAYLGSVAVVDGEWTDGYVSQHVALCRLDTSKVLPIYIGYYMLTTDGQNQLTSGAVGGTKVQLALDDIRELSVPVPPRSRQAEDVERLDRAMTRIDTLVSRAERFIELARERRAALITAAVTGQIDVTAASA